LIFGRLLKKEATMRKFSKISAVLVICAVCIFLPESGRVSAQDVALGLAGKLVVRQQMQNISGVLVSQPDPLDIEIVSIIKNNNIKSFKDYFRWLSENIEFKEDDEKDEWLSPRQMLRRGCGDCEDHAFLNAAFLRVFGYKPRILAMGGFTHSHALCVFKENGYYSWIDNTVLKRTDAKSIVQLSKYIFVEYRCQSILELDLAAKRYSVLFQR